MHHGGAIMKYKRHSKILKIISDTNINTQEGITKALRADGFNVTQATVSRDIKELGLIKLPTADGSYKYAVASHGVSDVPAKHLDMFSGAVKSVTCALHTIVIKTFPGAASAVAATIDNAIGNEILGSIAGDDAILVITESEAKAVDIRNKLAEIFK
jgi:transcriptional regulator of arginine metabolism